MSMILQFAPWIAFTLLRNVDVSPEIAAPARLSRSS